jgi:hypothetical protein
MTDTPAPLADAPSSHPADVMGEEVVFNYLCDLRVWLSAIKNLNAQTTRELSKLKMAVRANGGCPTAEQGKQIMLLKRRATFLLTVHAGLRTELRNLKKPGCPPILHINFMHTCRGMLYGGPALHEGVASLWMAAALMNVTKITPDAQLAILSGAFEAICRSVAHVLDTSPDFYLDGLNMVINRVIGNVMKLFVANEKISVAALVEPEWPRIIEEGAF